MTSEAGKRRFVVSLVQADTPGRSKSFLKRCYDWRSQAGKRRWVLTVLLCLYGFALLWLLQGAKVVLSADLHTEQVRFVVADPSQAAFFIDGLVAAPLGNEQHGPCLTGSFRPAKGAEVTYGRRGDGPVEVTILPARVPGEPAEKPAGRYLPSGGGQPVTFSGATYMAGDAACRHPETAQFPIWGNVAVGLELRPQAGADRPEPGLLIDGKIDVAARSRFSGTLYAVTTMQVPVGARLQTDDGSDDAELSAGTRSQAKSGIWWGIAYVDSYRTGLVVELGTEAPKIALYRPNQTRADVIEASGLTQLTEDPDIVRFHILLLILIGLGVFSEWLGKFLHELGEE